MGRVLATEMPDNRNGCTFQNVSERHPQFERHIGKPAWRKATVSPHLNESSLIRERQTAWIGCLVRLTVAVNPRR
jgi:hypothetical protein